MKNLDIYKLQHIELKHQYKGDLLHHEGPLLSHFVEQGNPNEHYFYKWSDNDEECNRWLVFKVSIEDLNVFFAAKLSLLQLIQKNAFVYLLDYNTNQELVSTFVCPTPRIPEVYLPFEMSFFKEGKYEEYALLLKKSLEQKAKDDFSEKELLILALRGLASVQKKQEEHTNLLKLIFSIMEGDSLGDFPTNRSDITNYEEATLK